MKHFNKLFFVAILSLFAAPLFSETWVSAERQKLIDYGLTLQGVRYVYGGKKPETGLDCSGFVSYVAKESLGKDIMYSAATMYKMMEHIDPSEREPGDLIFFAVRNGDSYRISHVGIYLGLYHGEGELDGERLFLHSASDGKYTGVIVSSINDKYWKKYIYGYARFLTPTEVDSEEEVTQSTGVVYADTLPKLNEPSEIEISEDVTDELEISEEPIIAEEN